MFEQKKDPQEIVREEGLEVVSDEKALAEVVKKVISNNTKLVEDYKKGKDKVFGFLVGQAMKETKRQSCWLLHHGMNKLVPFLPYNS